MTSLFENKSSIPTGSDLRALLNSEHISYGEVHIALKEKGIFVGNADKTVTVPILSATLLTPQDFLALIDSSVDRESKPKIKVSGLDLVSITTDWITPLKNELFTSDFDPSSNIDSIEFSQLPGLVVNSANRVTIPYTLNRRDYSKDWVERELNFGGEIIIERQGSSLKLDFASTHSSRETEAINRKIAARVSKILNNAKAVQSETPRRITFNSFSNVERVRFFKRLTGGVPKYLTLGSVNDMEISRDLTGPALPNDPQVAWMNQSVKRLKIDGERLNDIFLISDEKYYPFYHVQRIDINFPYTIASNQGTCRVAFSFSSPTRSEDDSELTFEFPRITYKNQVNSDSKKSISSALGGAVKSLVESEYERVISERVPNPP